MGESITKLEITFKQEQSRDNSALIDRLNIVQDTTTSIETRIGSLEKAVPEATNNLVLEIDAKLKGYDESASQKIREAEDNIQKNAQDIASQSNLLKEHTENINNFISSNTTFNNQFIALESKSEDFLKYLQVERQRIDNLDESVQKARPEIKRNTERLDGLDAHHNELAKNLNETSKQVQDNSKEITSLKQVTTNQNNNLGDLEGRVKQNEDQIKHIDDTLDGLHKTVAIFEGRHVETVEKMKEVTVLASNIQVQLKEQEQKMVEENSNDLNQIRIQIQDIENQNGISNQKITELDNGNQSLLEKLLGLEKSIGDRMEGLDNTDDSLLSKINNLEKDNAQSLTDFRKDLDNKLTEHEKDVDGKLQVVNNNANSLIIKLNSLDTDNKNNSQTIVNLQESIYLQTEQVKKVDAERQQAEAKAKEDFEATVANNTKAIDALKSEVEESITKLEITFKQEQSKDNSALIDRLNIVQDTTTSNETRIGLLENAVPEATKNLVLEIDAKLKGYDESGSQKIREAEDNIQKIAQDIASQSNLLKEHTENINNF